MEAVENNSTSFECEFGIPTAAELFDALQLNHQTFLILPIAFCFMTLAIYVINLRRELDSGNKDTKGNVAALVTLYPVSLNARRLISAEQKTFRDEQLIRKTSLRGMV